MTLNQAQKLMSQKFDGTKKSPPLVPSYRLIIIIILALLLFNSNIHLFSLNFAITCMVEPNLKAKHSNCNKSSLDTTTKYDNRSALQISALVKNVGLRRRVDWDRPEQSYILSAEAFGGTILVFITGLAIDQFGARWIMFFCFIGMSGASVAVPFLAHFHWTWVFFLRFFAGLIIETTYVAVQYAIVRWFPREHLGIVSSLAYSGPPLAGIFTMYISGELCASNNNWPAIFYIASGITTILAVVWLVFYYDVPMLAPWISKQEAKYISESTTINADAPGFKNVNIQTMPIYKTSYESKFRKIIENDTPNEKLNLLNEFKKNNRNTVTGDKITNNECNKKQRTNILQSWRNHPTINLLTSSAVWAIFISTFCSYYAYFFIDDFAPTYLKEVMCVSAHERGLLSTLPFVALLISRNISGISSDYVARRYKINETTLTKTYMAIVGVPIAVCTGLITLFSQATIYRAIICLMAAHFAFGFTNSAFLRANYLIAPRYMGALSAVFTTAMNLAGTTAPFVTGAVTRNETIQQWHTAFYIVSGTVIVGTTVFLIFGSAELQPWAELKNTEEETQK